MKRNTLQLIMIFLACTQLYCNTRPDHNLKSYAIILENVNFAKTKAENLLDIINGGWRNSRFFNFLSIGLLFSAWSTGALLAIQSKETILPDKIMVAILSPLFGIIGLSSIWKAFYERFSSPKRLNEKESEIAEIAEYNNIITSLESLKNEYEAFKKRPSTYSSEKYMESSELNKGINNKIQEYEFRCRLIIKQLEDLGEKLMYNMTKISSHSIEQL